MTPTPEMIALAERITSEQDWDINPVEACQRAALTAIMEAKKECLQLIADLPTGATEDVMQGHEDCYRAIEATFAVPPHIVSQPSATGSI